MSLKETRHTAKLRVPNVFSDLLFKLAETSVAGDTFTTLASSSGPSLFLTHNE